MEVHRHSKKEKKEQKWKSYFWEFFMLFLAVTLGFFVENLREHYVEHQWEKEYMKMLVKDLAADTISLDSNRVKRTIRQEQLNRLINLLGQKDLKKNVAAIYRLADSTDGYETFIRNDRTIQQFKNAGGMRMIRNDTVSASIMDYDTYIISEIEPNNETEASRISFFDAQCYYRCVKGDTSIPFSFRSFDMGVVNDITGSLFQVMRISENNRDCGDKLKDKAKKLIRLIQEEYPSTKK
jgi:hypothetical protein